MYCSPRFPRIDSWSSRGDRNVRVSVRSRTVAIESGDPVGAWMSVSPALSMISSQSIG
jgi:hypothetical protein